MIMRRDHVVFIVLYTLILERGWITSKKSGNFHLKFLKKSYENLERKTKQNTKMIRKIDINPNSARDFELIYSCSAMPRDKMHGEI